MQVDGAEEELPDELENACSDDGKQYLIVLELPSVCWQFALLML